MVKFNPGDKALIIEPTINLIKNKKLIKTTRRFNFLGGFLF